MQEKRMYQKMQLDYDKAYGFNDFPYTHGDEVERAQQDATQRWREELVDELEKKGAIQNNKTRMTDTPSKLGKEIGEEELKSKAQILSEAKSNDHMLNLQTGSNILRNQIKPDKIEFKSQQQEALYNKFI